MDSLNNIRHWVKDENGKDIERIVPITFGNYEKSIKLGDMERDLLSKNNYNFVPKLILSFNGINKAADRDTNKFQKIKKRFRTDNGDIILNFGYNSLAYDYQYTLTLHARGLIETFMIIEQILPLFRPSYPIGIKEYPLFDDKTETTLLIGDPEFEILDEFDEFDVNLITVTMPLTLRGNIYSPLMVTAPIKTLTLINNLWYTHNLEDSEKASVYDFDICENGKPLNIAAEEHYRPSKTPEAVTEETVTPTECVEIPYTTDITEEDFDNINTENNRTIITEQNR